MSKKKIIFFDWDGTIVSPKLAEEANIARTTLIESNIDKNELLNLQRDEGDNHYKIVQNLLKSKTGIEDLDEVKRMQVYLFAFFYLEKFRLDPSKYLLFDLKKLKEFKKKHNLEFVVITGLFKEIINGCLRKIDPNRELFSCAYGIENNLVGDKTNFITSAIKKYSDAKPFLIIGDKDSDIQPGINHNLKTIFCNYGHEKSEKADVTINNPEELLLTIEKLL